LSLSAPLRCIKWVPVTGGWRVAILSVASCDRKQVMLQLCGPPWLVCNFSFLLRLNFWVPFILLFKARAGAQAFIWKWMFIHVHIKLNFHSCTNKTDFHWKVVHKTSVSSRGRWQLGNGPFSSSVKQPQSPAFHFANEMWSFKQKWNEKYSLVEPFISKCMVGLIFTLLWVFHTFLNCDNSNRRYQAPLKNILEPIFSYSYLPLVP